MSSSLSLEDMRTNDEKREWQLVHDELWNECPGLLSIHLPELPTGPAQQTHKRSCTLLWCLLVALPPGQGAVCRMTEGGPAWVPGQWQHTLCLPPLHWPLPAFEAAGGQGSGQYHRHQSPVVEHQALDLDKVLPPTRHVALGKGLTLF